ncbi:MAG: anthranilate synthase component I family protein [Candidatus Dormibacteraeota bacterium]|nr:anthranilate synthase component I family protein [Candidatus Dormibacteraeota bacterium]
MPVHTVMPRGDLAPADILAAIGAESDGFILESAAGGGRWSFIGGAPLRVLNTAAEPDPLSVVQRDVADLTVARIDGLESPLVGGAVGMLTYEAARAYERIPRAPHDPFGVPDAWFGVHETLVAVDVADPAMHLIALAGGDGGFDDAVRRLESLHERLRAAHPMTLHAEASTAREVDTGQLATNMSRRGFMEAVQRTREHIAAGDIFQLQLSRRFTVPLQAHPLAVYRRLRTVNPSPYMVYLATPHGTLVGASPEMLVRVNGDHISYHPIAGTRRRGRDEADDARMERELRSSDKEQAEHLMLVDLGRNDVGRVSATGTVKVTELMGVERYSHVMHLVSSIEGRLDSDRTSLDALRACFPAGTVTGAPKMRAMEIIATLEPEVRGPYAGAVGYVGFGGDLDTAITLRTLFIRDGVGYAQAAAGVVMDSTPEHEALEVDNKVAVLLQAAMEAA